MPTSKRKKGGQPGAPSQESLKIARLENRRLRRELKACQKRGENAERELGQLLHDGICQELSAVAFYLQGLRNQLDRNNQERIPKLVEQLSASVQKAVASAHGLSQRLRK